MNYINYTSIQIGEFRPLVDLNGTQKVFSCIVLRLGTRNLKLESNSGQ